MFLKLGHKEILIPFFISGMIFHKREIYTRALCLFCIIMIFNTLLKNFFKIPLFPHLGPGYAFPSGHMHAAVVFYGYILYRIKDYKIKTIIAISLCGLGFSLVYQRYHNLYDILGAIAFGVVELMICAHLEKRKKNLAAVALIFSIVIIGILLYMCKIEPHVLLAFYALLGIILGTKIFPEQISENIFRKFIALFLTIVLWYAIFMISRTIGLENLKEYYYLSQIKFFFLAMAIFYGPFLVNRNALHRKRDTI
jgi:undecaprenyl-diphosphatase